LGRMHRETAVPELRMERDRSDQLEKQVKRLTRQLAKLRQPRAECQARRHILRVMVWVLEEKWIRKGPWARARVQDTFHVWVVEPN
jgi:hypothetical protein